MTTQIHPKAAEAQARAEENLIQATFHPSTYR